MLSVRIKTDHFRRCILYYYLGLEKVGYKPRLQLVQAVPAEDW